MLRGALHWAPEAASVQRAMAEVHLEITHQGRVRCGQVANLDGAPQQIRAEVVNRPQYARRLET
eukprot:1849280-Lingulodinium_polyedra.AAC.1